MARRDYPSLGILMHAGIVTSSLSHNDTPLFVNPSKMAHYSCGIAMTARIKILVLVIGGGEEEVEAK
jgi:hypothetical protein